MPPGSRPDHHSVTALQQRELSARGFRHTHPRRPHPESSQPSAGMTRAEMSRFDAELHAWHADRAGVPIGGRRRVAPGLRWRVSAPRSVRLEVAQDREHAPVVVGV
jgi:hypothetical protein